jgi:hypothetical protein
MYLHVYASWQALNVLYWMFRKKSKVEHANLFKSANRKFLRFASSKLANRQFLWIFHTNPQISLVLQSDDCKSTYFSQWDEDETSLSKDVSLVSHFRAKTAKIWPKAC